MIEVDTSIYESCWFSVIATRETYRGDRINILSKLRRYERLAQISDPGRATGRNVIESKVAFAQVMTHGNFERGLPKTFDRLKPGLRATSRGGYTAVVNDDLHITLLDPDEVDFVIPIGDWLELTRKLK